MKKSYSFEALVQLVESIKKVAEKPASDTEAGRSRFATQEEINDGTPGVAVTPDSLLYGIVNETIETGAIDLPECLGGLSIRWGYGEANKPDTEEPIYTRFKESFKERQFGAIAIHTGAVAEDTNITFDKQNSDKEQAIFNTNYTGQTEKIQVFYIAIGK
ncbi:MAG: hypothetical protein OXC41_00960 [Gammaproteobacteria bacterium]|nr:hypothetical protein [Gammaproteobacteria bacterium]